MMLRDFMRYPSVFKKSVRGKMFLFFRNLKLCPRENLIKMLPEGAILWVQKTPLFGAFIKILKVAFDCQSPCQQLCPRADFFKMTPKQVKFTRISGKIDKIIINRF